MTDQFAAIWQFEWRAHRRSVGLWAGFLLAAAMSCFSSVDSWELPAVHLVIDVTSTLVPFFFLLAAFITLNSTGREERERFTDVFQALPPSNGAIYAGKLVGAALSLSLLAALVFIALLIIGPIKGDLSAQYWLVAALGMLETVLALGTGLAVGTLVTALVANFRSRYVVALIWLVGSVLVLGLALSFGRYELLSLALFQVGDEPFFFSQSLGFYPVSQALLRHIVVQVTWIALQLMTARLFWLRQREPVQKALRNATIVTLAVFVVAAGWNYTAWQVKRTQARATAAYYMGGTESVEADWRKVGGSGALMPFGEQVPDFRVTTYDIDLSLDKPEQGLAATVVMTIKPAHENPERLFFTLQQTLQVKTVETNTTPATDRSTQIGAVTSNWQVATWQRAGDFLAVDVPDTALGKNGGLLLRVTYTGQPGGVWRGARGLDVVQFVSKQGAYLNAILGWYPLPGGWRLGTTVVEVRNGKHVPVGVLLPTQTQGDNVYRALAADFRLRVQTVPGQTAFTNLLSSSGDMMQGWADGVSLFTGTLSVIETPGFKLAASPRALHDTDNLTAAFSELRNFYEQALGIKVPPIQVVTVPGWLDRVFTRYISNHVEGHTRSSAMLGSALTWRETDLAIALRDAHRWKTREQWAKQWLWWATAPLNTGVQKALWSRGADHTDQLANPVVAGVSQYLTMLWFESVNDERGVAEYKRHMTEYQADLANPSKEQEYRTAQVVLRLDKERQRTGLAGVGVMVRRLLAWANQGALTWSAWGQLAQDGQESAQPEGR